MDVTPPSPLLKRAAAAAYLRMAPGTMDKWRVDGIGPAYVKCGRSVRYRLDVLDAWLAANTVETA